MNTSVQLSLLELINSTIDHSLENTIISYNGQGLPDTIAISHKPNPIHLIEIYDDHTAPQTLELSLASQACLYHTRIHLKNHTTVNTTITQAKHSRYHATVIYLSGATHESHFTLELTGEQSESIFYAGFLPQKKERSDLKIHVHHHGEHSNSKIILRGVLDQESALNCEGKITIHKTANHAQAELENKNILLSPLAHINTQPILEVHTEEVKKCKHGATVGSLDNEALFYLKSRGLPSHQAKKLLIEAFLSPILNTITQPIIKEFLLENAYA